MGRGSVGKAAGVFKGGVEHSSVAPDGKSLVDGNLSRMLIDASFYYQRLNTPSGLDLDDAVAQVAVFHGGNAGDNFNAFHISGREHACACRRCLAGCRVIAQPKAVNIDGRAECRVARLRGACVQGNAWVGHEGGIGHFATGQQRRNVGYIDDLLIVKNLTVNGIGCRGRMIRPTRDNLYLIEFQIFFLQCNYEVGNIFRNLNADV